MQHEIERRTFGVEFRAESGEAPKLVGYAAMFGVLSEDLGGFRERIKRGAFKRALAEGADVQALIEHQGGLQTIGRTTSGTLRLKEDRDGLLVEIDPPDTQAGRDVQTLVARGDLSKMSFAFRTVDDVMSTEGGERVRELRDVDLFDVSIVGRPAYTQTTVAKRALDLVREADEREAEVDADVRARRLALANSGG